MSLTIPWRNKHLIRGVRADQCVGHLSGYVNETWYTYRHAVFAVSMLYSVKRVDLLPVITPRNPGCILRRTNPSMEGP